jgi:cell wall-associated NlpC family hydrolase
MSRAAFLEYIQAQKGKPYVWGSKGDLHVVSGAVQVECFDCSGLVTRGMLQAGYPRGCPICQRDLLGFHGAQRLFDELVVVSPGKLQAGDLMFFGAGPRHVTHVMVWLSREECMGASGGNSGSIDPVVSLRLGQKVKVQPTTYRPDFVGYRALPLY